MKYFFVMVGLFLLSLFVFLAGTGAFPFLEDSDMKDGRVHIHKSVQMPKHIPDLNKQTLIFFGYVGCSDICTPRMQEIAVLVKQYEQQKANPNLDVLFINLDTKSTTKQADTFAKSFHKNFMGITLPKKELMKITLMFNAYYSASLTDSTKINHTQYLYLMRKDSNQNHYLRNIYTKVPYDSKTILNDLIKEEQ